MKKLLALLTSVILFTSCGIFSSLHSTTTIKPKEKFELGNNEHGSFRVSLKNISDFDLEVYHAPINGGKHSSQIIKPNDSVDIKIDKNTALIINNNSTDTATVSLKVTGDLGLSMGYQH